MSNVEPSTLVFLKTYNTEFDDIVITFTDQNGRPLEIEHKVNFTLLIDKQKCNDILQNQGQKNMLKDMDFYHLRENNYWIQDQMPPKKLVHKAGEYLRNKIADVVTMSNDDSIEEQEPVEETIIPPKKRDEIFNKLRRVL